MDFFSYPEIQVKPNELATLERHNIYTYDLLTVEASEIAKKTNLSIETIIRISDLVFKISTPKLDKTAFDCEQSQRFLTTGDGRFDEILGGGVPVQHITEFVGESGVGKSQFMTQFCITAQLPPSLGGLGREVVYISTESGLATSRAREITTGLRARYPHHELLLPLKPLDNIHVVICPDLELQDHILYYQLPVLLKQKRGKIGAIMIDSIAANYRAEHEGRNPGSNGDKRAGDMAMRTKELTKLSAHLRRLAVKYDLAVIVANQVSDRIGEARGDSLLSLDHQSQWFSGWQSTDLSPKMPALGLVWANAVHTRVALKKVNNNYGSGETVREMALVYSPFASNASIAYKVGLNGVESA